MVAYRSNFKVSLIDLQLASLFEHHRVRMSKERIVGHWHFIFLGIAAVTRILNTYSFLYYYLHNAELESVKKEQLATGTSYSLV
ncbi:hypothetical protein EB796_015387 [Bugula neritina]|uniref:Uncharacterized protein n=1 Tax=Bugula neritina TaxID=10212 RepID=A0A7J7JJ43_BUGNE|nr:hypothetical protein EB796_015387 [Bugula neritina]